MLCKQKRWDTIKELSKISLQSWYFNYVLKGYQAFIKGRRRGGGYFKLREQHIHRCRISKHCDGSCKELEASNSIYLQSSMLRLGQRQERSLVERLDGRLIKIPPRSTPRSLNLSCAVESKGMEESPEKCDQWGDS